jgi:hypothetical protein
MNVSYGNNTHPAAGGVWTHLAWVRDNGTNRFFVDGTEIGSNTDSLINNGRIHLFIKPGGGQVPQGNVDEIRFSTFLPGQFNRNGLLINASAHNALVRADSPAAFWRLDESTGPSARDRVGGYDGTYYGTETFSVTGALPADGDTAVEFDGSSGYVAVPFASALNPQGPFSVEAWVRPNIVPDSGGTPCPISSAQFSGNRSGWQIRERDTGWEFVLYNHVSSGTALNIRGGSAPQAGTWCHLVAVYDGTNGYLYVNGTLAVSGSAAGFIANYDDGVNGPGPFTIGARSSLNNNFNGRVDEAAFYTRALTTAEVRSHYLDQPRLTPATPGSSLILNWPVGTLQQSTNAVGPYFDVPGATSPYTVPFTNAAGFFRIKQ